MNCCREKSHKVKRKSEKQNAKPSECASKNKTKTLWNITNWCCSNAAVVAGSQLHFNFVMTLVLLFLLCQCCGLRLCLCVCISFPFTSLVCGVVARLILPIVILVFIYLLHSVNSFSKREWCCVTWVFFRGKPNSLYLLH